MRPEAEIWRHGEASTNAVEIRMTRPAPGQLDIACVIPSLRTGGSERILSGLANEASAHGHRIAILTLMAPGEAPFYPLASGVALINLDGLGAATSLGKPSDFGTAAWRIRRALQRRRPELLLGFTSVGSMLAILASRGLAMPVVAAERSDPRGHGQRIGRFRTRLRDLLYARADHVVVQTSRARRAIPWLADSRISCIANPVSPMARQADPGQPGPDGRFRLIGIGRLDSHKGFDLLISAFTQAAERFPLWDLVIHGDGPERGELEALARQLPAGRILLPGSTAEIESALVASHALAFPSRFEGFPNALAEAMAAGLPTIGFRDVCGVEDLIATDPQERVTGMLADLAAPVESLTNALVRLLSDPLLRTQLGERARQHVAAFAPQIHYEQWERLLTRVAQSHGQH
jgi:GalNAc-alpha-(1->4)-GalNAc-alpha-(1->3)-diNAcBac-PP-undecaprenol alpha-1,4-N-acetyl-D-galactosaminyltransferase